ncbi:MAG: hypothetical protein ABJ084_08200 [Halioglobus sp.]
MARKLLKGLAALPALLMLVMGVNWIVDPASAAQGLGMTYLEGEGRSTQIGDMTSFFIGVGVMALLGLWTENRTWLYSASLLLGGTAVFRTLAWLVHDASFATASIAVEVISVLLFLAAARQLQQE